MIDAKAALDEAQETGFVTITEGTKGGRTRKISITSSEEQLNTLSRAANTQGDTKAVMPPDQNWRSWREGGLREAREAVLTATGGGFHDLRAAYACQRYQMETGHKAPVFGAGILDREVDYDARKIISLELGHERIEVASAYLGQSAIMRSKARKAPPPQEPGDSVCA